MSENKTELDTMTSVVNEEPSSKTLKVINFFIRIFMIPVKVTNQRLKFSWKSPRLYVGIFLWTIIPISCYFAYSYLEYLRDPGHWSSEQGVALLFCNYAGQAMNAIFLFGPACMAYLVLTCGVELKEKARMPKEYLEIVLAVLGFFLASFFLTSEETDALSADLMPVYYISTFGYSIPFLLLTLVWTFLINVYMEAFRRKASIVTTNLYASKRNVANTCEELLQTYQKLNDGLGPSMLYHISMSVWMITIMSYNAIFWFRKEDQTRGLFVMLLCVQYTMIAFNLCTLAESVKDAMQSSVDLLRATIRGPCSPEEEKELNIVMSMIQGEGELSAMGWFGVDKSMFVATGSTVLTYAIILLQS